MIRYFLVFITKREKKRGLPPPLLSSPLLSKALLLSFPSSKNQKTRSSKKNAKEKTRAQNKTNQNVTKQNNTRARTYSKQKEKMGFLGLGRKKKSEAELLEEERLRRQSVPWYARLFGTECCGNRGGKREKKEEKKNVGA